jgi:hypothetical protein
VVTYLCGGYRVSERRACTVVLLPRATHRYQSIRDPLTALRMRLRELAQARIRYGYRKLRVLLIGLASGQEVGLSSVPRGEAGIAKAAEGTANGLGAQPAEAAGGTAEPGGAWISWPINSVTAGGFGR